MFKIRLLVKPTTRFELDSVTRSYSCRAFRVLAHPYIGNDTIYESILVLDGIRKLKIKSIDDLAGARKRIDITAGPTMKTWIRDERIREAWLALQEIPPWSTEKFINELAEYEDAGSIEIIDKDI